MHAEFGGDLGDACEPGAGDDFEDRHGTVDRLHRAGVHGAGVRLAVAHFETVAHMTQHGQGRTTGDVG